LWTGGERNPGKGFTATEGEIKSGKSIKVSGLKKGAQVVETRRG